MLNLISLNEYLNENNIWTNRLLGIEPFSQTRNRELVEREYNEELYGQFLKNFESKKEASKKSQNLHISLKEDIYETNHAFAYFLYREQVLKQKLSEYPSERYCELGCGFGQNFYLFSQEIYGGEFSENAVKLAQKKGNEVYSFNYYQLEDYEIIKERSTVYTAHSIEQIPDASIVLEGLESQKEKIEYVIHFEPSMIANRKSLLGILRNKYIELNDYNRNLFSLLHSRNDIEILEFETDVFGVNPLNSTNIIVWRFK